MYLEITDVILIALFIEAIVNALKPIWTKGETQFTVSEYVSMGMGILLAVSCKINMLAYMVEIIDYPIWVEYIFYVLTGVAIGRGTNFLYDLWNKLKEWQSGQILPVYEMAETIEADVDLEITNWSLAQLKTFCTLNYIDAIDCVTREDYIQAIKDGGMAKETQPPEAGGTE